MILVWIICIVFLQSFSIQVQNYFSFNTFTWKFSCHKFTQHLNSEDPVKLSSLIFNGNFLKFTDKKDQTFFFSLRVILFGETWNETQFIYFSLKLLDKSQEKGLDGRIFYTFIFYTFLKMIIHEKRNNLNGIS
jgi:hypothetical protein